MGTAERKTTVELPFSPEDVRNGRVRLTEPLPPVDYQSVHDALDRYARAAMEIKRQRDELAAALRKLVERLDKHFAEHPSEDWRGHEHARAALARAGGEP